LAHEELQRTPAGTTVYLLLVVILQPLKIALVEFFERDVFFGIELGEESSSGCLEKPLNFAFVTLIFT